MQKSRLYYNSQEYKIEVVFVLPIKFEQNTKVCFTKPEEKKKTKVREKCLFGWPVSSLIGFLDNIKNIPFKIHKH